MTITIFVLSVVAVALTVVSLATLWWMLHAWRTPQSHEATNFPAADDPELSFSIIMPCRDERYEVMEATLDRLLDQTHPRVEVVVSVGDDDLATVAHAELLAAQHPDRVLVSINHDPIKNKPRQLNTSLLQCRNEIVGIVDAESLTHRDLLLHVDTTFRQRAADVVQGAVHLINYRSSWFALRNCLEYRIWFRSRLHGHAAAGFIPLGGNTVFIRRDLLVAVGGWDGDCLAEDCEIGVRLSVMQKRIVCAYTKELTTLEEAPETIRAFVKQRTRWGLGFMQVMAKGEWRRLPTLAQRLGAWWTLAQQYAMAFTGVVLPLGLVAALFLRVPTPVAMLTYIPLAAAVLMVCFEVLVLHEFGEDMKLEVRARDYVVLIASTPLYQALLAFSALRAVWKYVSGDFGWEKTAHRGAHLEAASVVALDGASS